MDELAARVRRVTAVNLLLPLFFASGATALTYQTLWVRELQLVFGTSTFAISTVLAAFMGGLAAGGFVMARYADDLPRPLFTYGVLEVGIGLYALVFPWLVAALAPVYLNAWRAIQPGPVVFGLIQFSLMGVALLLPTAAMGATLPLLARFATRRLGGRGRPRRNAVCGEHVRRGDRDAALWVRAPPRARSIHDRLGCRWRHLLLGAAAIVLSQWANETRAEQVVDDLESPLVPALLPVSVAIGLAGFAALVYEVAWTRLLGLMLGGSTYTFSVMLVAFLVGIALGGMIGGRFADRWLREYGQREVLLAFAVIEVCIALVSYAMMYLYPELPFVYVDLFDRFGVTEIPWAVWAVSLTVAGLVMTPPAILMGMHFPLAVRAVVGNEERLGGPVGVVYGANTLGGVLGAFLAGFVLLPSIGVQGTVYVAGLAEILAAGVLVWWVARDHPNRAVLGLPVGLAAVGLLAMARVPPWDPMLMTSGMYHYASSFEDHSREGILEYSVELYELLYYDEGLSSVVTVAKNVESDNIWLANNGKVDASTTTDMPTQIMCALLPTQYVEDPEDVLVIGLASGITAGALTLVPDIDRLDVVELEPAIETAAQFFGPWNHDVLDDPRVDLIHNDGRNHVLLTPPQTYDLIVSEPSNPWISGVSNLFTREFFELGKTRLKPGGVWSQWVQMYGMDADDLSTLLKTFATVYPHVIVYATIEDADLVLVGSNEPLEATEASARRLFAWPMVADQLREIDFEGPLDLVSLYQMDRAAMLELGGDAPLNTDDNMVIEYSAPLHLHVDTQDENFELLLKHATIPFEALDYDRATLIRLARVYHRRENPVRAVSTMAEAIKRTSDPVEREALLQEAEAWQRVLEAELEGLD